jgi:hypothetical protein
MRQWVEYQMGRGKQVRNFDWDNLYHKVENFNDTLSEAFGRIIANFENGTNVGIYENVFLREDHIKRTAASTGGEVSENEYRSWQNEYHELMSRHGHWYVNNFGADTELIYNTIATRLKLKPETVRIRLQVEKPGYLFVVHIDRHRYKVWDMEEEVVYEKVRDQHAHNIYVTFAKDQQLGQFFGMGFGTLRWSAGDTYTWEHQSVPHCTANAGYHNNYVFVTTGEPLDYKD